MSVQGLIGRHVSDIRTGTRTLIQPDPRDPISPPVPWDGPAVAGPNGRITVAVTKETAGYTMHPGISELIDEAAAHLADAGYNVVEADPPPVLEAARGWFSAATTEMKVTFDAPLRQFGSETINRIFDWYFELSNLLDLDGYITTFAARTGLMRDWKLFLNEHPLVLTPFLMRPMFDWNYDATGLAAVADLFQSAVYSTGINYLGLPAGVICPGLVDGRPAAVQLVGDYYREDVICDALQAIEDRSGVLVHDLWSR
jgi:amidase